MYSTGVMFSKPWGVVGLRVFLVVCTGLIGSCCSALKASQHCQIAHLRNWPRPKPSSRDSFSSIGSALWTNDAQPSATACVSYTTRSVINNFYLCANGINDGKYAYNNLQQYDATW